MLGAAAGGGLPQWNCGCANCADARSGARGMRAQSQSSIAVSPDGERWVLFNASPDLREQLGSFPAVQPRGLRGSGIAAVLLTDAEVDHTAGLLLLREGGTLALYSTAFVHEALTGNGLLGTLAAYLDLRWTEVVPGRILPLKAADGGDLGLDVEPFEVAGDPPLYHRGDGAARERAGAEAPPAASAGHTIGVAIRAVHARGALLYVPGAGAADAFLLDRIGSEDFLLWDGTFWVEDELVRLGVSQRPASAMGHLPISGSGGSLERFRGVAARRKAYVHVNNTNPILRAGSPERRAVEAAGWEVAFDGMEFEI